VTTYPAVLGEVETLARVCAGASIARFGDGEFALAEDRSIRPQRCQPDLAERLRGILRGEAGDCLVGIPNLLAPLPLTKAQFWTKYTRCAALLTPGYPYVSSFITRPDNAPWLDGVQYWTQLESLWRGRDVTLVRGDDPHGTGAVSLVAADLTSAASVTEILAPGVNAWSAYATTLDRIGTPARALLCLGATATVLAVDLCARGVHAIDLGHVGMFLRRHRAGEPMQRDRKAVR
jgi:hypothetical protein